MLAADFGTGEVLWSFLWFFIFIIWIYLLIFIFSDIFRSEDLGGWSKAIWTIVIIFLPYIGIFAYLIIRGGSMAERQAKQMQAQQSAVDSYIRTTAAGATDAEQLAKLAELHSSGKLDDAEYATAKAKVLG
jgi:type VI protein secretion system component VasK